MKYNTEDFCNCGHLRYNHFDDYGFCYMGPLFIKNNPYCHCIKFKLDNLKYLELKSKENE